MSPDLRIIPLSSIKLQEAVTNEKARSLANNMRMRCEIINPVVVAPLKDQQFIQLDGASRIAALGILGAPWAFVHVVDYQRVAITTWGHVTQMDISALRRLGCDSSVKLTDVEEEIDGFELAAMARFIAGEHVGIYSPNGPIERAQVTSRLIELYRLKPEQRVDMERNGIARILEVASKLGSDGVVVEFSPFSHSEIIRVVDGGGLLPPGVTKHRLEKRVLMNYPLDQLLDDSSDQTEQQGILEDSLSRMKEHPYCDCQVPDFWDTMSLSRNFLLNASGGIFKLV